MSSKFQTTKKAEKQKTLTLLRSYALTVFFLLFISPFSSSAQPLMKSEYSYRRYTTQDGLPSNKNVSILQDGKGFIWIAGGSGLVRYDGFTFTNYLEGTDANLHRLDTDEKGNIRAFSRNLMYSFDKNNKLVKTVLSEDKSLTSNLSFALPNGYGIYYEPKSERNQALYKIKNNQLEKVLEHPLLENLNDDIHTYFDVEKQELYILCDEDEPMRIIANQKEIASFPNVNAKVICKYNNSMFILADNGIYSFDNQIYKPLIKADFSRMTTPIKAIFDSKGNLCFNNDNLLCRFDGNKIEPIFEAGTIKDFIFDRENNLWVVTFQGVYNLFKTDFKNYRLKEENDVVRMVMYHPEKEAVIAGTLNGKIIEIKKNGINEIRYPKSPYADFFYDYAEKKGNSLYLPGAGDILLINNNEKRWLNLPVFNTPIFVVSLPNGNLLEGGFEYLFEFSPNGKLRKDFGEYPMLQGLYAKPCFDKKGRLWLGGSKGITIYDYNSHQIVKTIFNDSVKIVRFMNNDAEGNVWFASENRLYVSYEDTMKLEKTLPQLIKGIYFTNKNNRLIVRLLKGMLVFDKEKQNYICYNHKNGFTGGESSSGSFAEDAEENIWVPSMEGLFRFDPEKWATTSDKPNLHLFSVMYSKNNIHWEPVDETTTKWDHQYKNISFNFIGLLFSAAENVRYHYRLIGFQNEWSEPTKNREVTFNNLPPGNYVFEIYADAGTEESKSEIQSFTFSIKPAFWQTAWFLFLCIISLVLSGAGATLYIQQRKNQILLEKLRTEKELNELRISAIRLKSIPHFNANILAAIEYYISNRTKDETMRILEVYSDFTYQTLSEVDKAARPIEEELAYVKMYLDLEKVRFMDKFNFEIHVEEGVDKKVQLPNMILHTYCENAVKHGLMSLKSGGLLTINVSKHGNFVRVSVEDNGVGRKVAAQNKHIHSTKQGLAILNRQIEIYNRFNKEKINHYIEDLEKGTRFTVEVPEEYCFIN